MNLQDKTLVVVSPHFQKFLQSQIVASKAYFANVNVLVPQPWFPSSLLHLQPIERHLAFLRSAKSFCGIYSTTHGDIPVYCPKFPSLPVPWIRSQMPLWVARNCVKVLNTERIKFDLIHCHRLDYSYVGSILKRNHNFPLIVTCHGSDIYEFPHRNRFHFDLAQLILRSVDHIIAVGSSDAKGLISLGYPLSKITIIPNGFDERLFRPIRQETAKRKIGFQNKDNIILSIGSLLPVKGHSDLLQAIRHLSKLRSDFHLVIVGSGPLESRLNRQARNLGITRFVTFTGAQPLKSIPLWLSASRFLVISSINEGFPTVIPEAFSCGKPVISTKVGSIPDALSDETSGILVSPANPIELSSAMNQALEVHWNSKNIIKKSKEYTLGNISKRLKAVYSKVLTSEGRSEN